MCVYVRARVCVCLVCVFECVCLVCVCMRVCVAGCVHIHPLGEDKPTDLGGVTRQITELDLGVGGE